MSAVLEKLEHDVLELPQEERAFLADRLLSSLGGGALSDVDAAWVAEVEKRHEAFAAGRWQPSPAAEVFAEADKRCK